MKKHVARRLIAGALSVGVVAAAAGTTTWANADETPVRLVIGLKSGADATASVQAASALGAKPTNLVAAAQEALAPLGARTLSVPASRQSLIISALRRDPDIAYVEVDQTAKAQDLKPNDPAYTSGDQPEVNKVRLPAAWQKTTGSAGVKIAVLDTGVDRVGDLTGAVAGGYNYWGMNGDTSDDSEDGHGTAVASLIAGRGNDGKGIAGGCWKCTIIPVKVLDGDGIGLYSDIAKGIVYATNVGAKIINMSLGGESSAKVLSDAVAYANSKGVLVVAAAGNDNSTKKFYPAAYPDVVGVGATARNSDARAYFSNYNKSGDSWVDLAAPGDVTVMTRSGAYESGWLGTSFASPIVAGAAGLIKSAHPDYNNWSLQRALIASGRKIASNGWTKYGMLDAGKAVTIGTDRIAPKISVPTPGYAALVHGKVTIKPKASDEWSGVKFVDLYVNGKWKARDSSAPYQFTYDSGVNNAKVTFLLKATDKAGNVGSSTRWVTADNIAPSVKITSGPKNNAKVKGKVTIKASAADRNGIRRVELLINGKVKATDTKAAYSLSFKAASQPKKMKVQIRAIDKAGNVKTTPVRNYKR
ncbi:S8 family serine peptidase [Actinoplanes sp. TFC3]|uniref:S8 family serine peptidase n=1 Tax=Actinoplanes sp. TFC3 TaxID=1710355 RepID=UPI00082975CE|nr:S8 family serine peptidase [Actinoplanes sp. TFC3]